MNVLVNGVVLVWSAVFILAIIVNVSPLPSGLNGTFVGLIVSSSPSIVANSLPSAIAYVIPSVFPVFVIATAFNVGRSSPVVIVA